MLIEKPKIILASYPRSGNTFLRNILHDVYGLFSWNSIAKYHDGFEKLNKWKELAGKRKSSAHLHEKIALFSERLKFPIIKTHELPEAILPYCIDNPVIIYLVRDGRDALVSQAHHNVDIVNPGSDFSISLKHSILAPRNTHFGGWSKNVDSWRRIASRIIYFEELIEEPIKVMKSIKGVINLPEPIFSKLPTLESQREGKSYFGGQSREKMTDAEKYEFNRKFYRSGQTEVWKTEMEVAYQKLFWKLHGSVAKEMGYQKFEGFSGNKWIKHD